MFEATHRKRASHVYDMYARRVLFIDCISTIIYNSHTVKFRISACLFGVMDVNYLTPAYHVLKAVL